MTSAAIAARHVCYCSSCKTAASFAHQSYSAVVQLHAATRGLNTSQVEHLTTSMAAMSSPSTLARSSVNCSAFLVSFAFMRTSTACKPPASLSSATCSRCRAETQAFLNSTARHAPIEAAGRPSAFSCLLQGLRTSVAGIRASGECPCSHRTCFAEQLRWVRPSTLLRPGWAS